MKHRPWITGACMLGGVLCLFSVLALTPLPAYAKAGAHAAVLEHCNWNRPGVDPFMGDVVAAVDKYTDIAPQVREQLKERMRARQYDEIVVISRDAIRGKGNYAARISDMHFGPGRVCRNVTRTGWTEQMQERGLVYCVQGQCILVPTVCRNVSRITQATSGAPPAAAGGAAPAEAPSAPAPADAGVPVIDYPGDAHGGAFTGAAPPAVVSSLSSLPFDYVHAGNTPPLPSSIGDGHTTGGGVGGVGGVPPGTTGSSFIEPYQPSIILPSLPPTDLNVLPAVPEPQTWCMLLAGLALIGYSARRGRSGK